MLESRGVLANSKRAVSDTYVSRFLPELNNSIADRALFTVILQPDEYTKPNLLANGTTGRVGIATYRSEDVPLMWSNEDRNFIETFYSEEIYVVYYRPFEWGPAYRLEMPTLLTKKIDHILAGFKKALISPDIIEPYPQFLVDKLCKQMPIALQAVMEGTTNALRQEFEPDLLRKFFGAYRTR
ncbi:MAG: hypothetical protein DPW11_04755 [bacterium]|nr:hypothetical protein [bacterium]